MRLERISQLWRKIHFFAYSPVPCTFRNFCCHIGPISDN
uniref:Uncharacterized protein n=1 Tax=Arundo donax TaxID=35708 RepID=A0A0A9B2I4_ARUDO